MVHPQSAGAARARAAAPPQATWSRRYRRSALDDRQPCDGTLRPRGMTSREVGIGSVPNQVRGWKASISRRRSVLLAPGRFGRMRKSPWRRSSSSRPCGQVIRRPGRRGHLVGVQWWSNRNVACCTDGPLLMSNINAHSPSPLTAGPSAVMTPSPLHHQSSRLSVSAAIKSSSVRVRSKCSVVRSTRASRSSTRRRQPDLNSCARPATPHRR